MSLASHAPSSSFAADCHSSAGWDCGRELRALRDAATRSRTDEASALRRSGEEVERCIRRRQVDESAALQSFLEGFHEAIEMRFERQQAQCMVRFEAVERRLDQELERVSRNLCEEARHASREVVGELRRALSHGYEQNRGSIADFDIISEPRGSLSCAGVNDGGYHGVRRKPNALLEIDSCHGGVESGADVVSRLAAELRAVIEQAAREGAGEAMQVAATDFRTTMLVGVDRLQSQIDVIAVRCSEESTVRDATADELRKGIESAHVAACAAETALAETAARIDCTAVELSAKQLATTEEVAARVVSMKEAASLVEVRFDSEIQELSAAVHDTRGAVIEGDGKTTHVMEELGLDMSLLRDKILNVSTSQLEHHSQLDARIEAASFREADAMRCSEAFCVKAAQDANVELRRGLVEEIEEASARLGAEMRGCQQESKASLRAIETSLEPRFSRCSVGLEEALRTAEQAEARSEHRIARLAGEMGELRSTWHPSVAANSKALEAVSAQCGRLAAEMTHLKQQGLSHEWVVPRCLQRLRYLAIAHEPGVWLDSPEFTLGCLEGLVLRLYPCGFRGGDGKCAIALHANVGAPGEKSRGVVSSELSTIGGALFSLPSRVDLGVHGLRQVAMARHDADSSGAGVLWTAESFGSLESLLSDAEDLTITLAIPAATWASQEETWGSGDVGGNGPLYMTSSGQQASTGRLGACLSQPGAIGAFPNVASPVLRHRVATGDANGADTRMAAAVTAAAATDAELPLGSSVSYCGSRQGSVCKGEGGLEGANITARVKSERFATISGGAPCAVESQFSPPVRQELASPAVRTRLGWTGFDDAEPGAAAEAVPSDLWRRSSELSRPQASPGGVGAGGGRGAVAVLDQGVPLSGGGGSVGGVSAGKRVPACSNPFAVASGGMSPRGADDSKPVPLSNSNPFYTAATGSTTFTTPRKAETQRPLGPASNSV